jgi:hypothetical protein
MKMCEQSYSKMNMCEHTPFGIHGQKSIQNIYFTRDKYVISLAPQKRTHSMSTACSIAFSRNLGSTSSACDLECVSIHWVQFQWILIIK